MIDEKNRELTAKYSEMSKHDITSTMVEYFQYKKFQYTRLDDAINQAIRDRKENDRKM